MPNIDKHIPGTFCWVELATTDPTAAKRFYPELFGWSVKDERLPDNSTYTTLQRNGRNVAALFPMRDDMRKQGIPPHWMSYVAVENVEKSLQKVKQLGGKVVAEPFDVMDHGRMAVFTDPTGATLSLWQAKKHIGIQVYGDAGTLCWNELLTRDVDGAKKFYGSLFGWTYKTTPDAMGGTYNEAHIGDRAIGGIFAITREMNAPPSWMPYFATEGCDQTVDRAKKLQGRTVMPPTDIPEVGRFAMLADAAGAHFNVLEMKKGMGKR